MIIVNVACALFSAWVMTRWCEYKSPTWWLNLAACLLNVLVVIMQLSRY